MTSITLNGYTDLPDGHAAAIATYLEMRLRPTPELTTPRPEISLAEMHEPDIATYRDLFRQIGSDWLWNSRLILDDAELGGILADPAVAIYLPVRDGRPIGMIELDFREVPSVELAFFGLVPDAIGSGTGRWLMEQALDLAWRDGIERVWLHTCTFDHPSALGFYRRSGFVPYARKLEMFPDPRLNGTLPREAAPHVPLIGKSSAT